MRSQQRPLMRFWALPISLSLLVAVFGVSAQDSIRKVKQYPDGTWLVEIDGQPHWAVPPARAEILHRAETEVTADLKQCEADLRITQGDLAKAKQNEQDAKNNTQDERVRIANIKQDYDAQSKLFSQCMALSKNGSGINNGWLRLGLDVAPTVVTLVKPCH